MGQNLKIQKRFEKRFYNHIRVVVCKKKAPKIKTPNIGEMRVF